MLPGTLPPTGLISLFRDSPRIESASTCTLYSSLLLCRRLHCTRIDLHFPLSLNNMSPRSFYVGTDVFPASSPVVMWDSACGLILLQLGSIPGGGFAAENDPVCVLFKRVRVRLEGEFLTVRSPGQRAQAFDTLVDLALPKDGGNALSHGQHKEPSPDALAEVGKLPV